MMSFQIGGAFISIGLLNQLMFGIEWSTEFWYCAINIGPIRIFVSKSNPLGLILLSLDDDPEE